MFFRKLLIFLLVIFISSCASTLKFERVALKKIKKVAVVVYTVPSSIRYKVNPRSKKIDNLKALSTVVAKKMAEGNGAKAAILSHDSFIRSLNKEGLGFSILTRKQMLKNRFFKKLYKPAINTKIKNTKSRLMGITAGIGPASIGPYGLNQFGLQTVWSTGEALIGSDEEMRYIKESIKALKVDAVLIINDPGYCFTCSDCIKTEGLMSGVASTGSAFVATLVNRKGEVLMNMKEWFSKSTSNAGMVSSVVNPLEHEKLFKGHGVKMAKIFSKSFRKKMTSKKD